MNNTLEIPTDIRTDSLLIDPNNDVSLSRHSDTVPQGKRVRGVVKSVREYIAMLEQQKNLNESLWGPFIYKGCVTMLIAESSAGKTTFLYRLAYALSLGREFLGFAPPRSLKILHLDQESKPGKKLAILKLLTDAPDDYDIYDMSFDGNTKLAFYSIGQVGIGFDVIIIDSLQTFDPPVDENNNSEGNESMQRFVDLANTTGAAVIVTHNSGKGNGKAKYKSRGAASRIDRTDVAVNLDIIGKNERELTIVKTRMDDIDRQLKYRFIGNLDVELSEPTERPKSQAEEMSDAILDLLLESNMPRSGLKKALDLHTSAQERMLDRVLQGLISSYECHKSEGMYVIGSGINGNDNSLV